MRCEHGKQQQVWNECAYDSANAHNAGTAPAVSRWVAMACREIQFVCSIHDYTQPVTAHPQHDVFHSLQRHQLAPFAELRVKFRSTCECTACVESINKEAGCESVVSLCTITSQQQVALGGRAYRSPRCTVESQALQSSPGATRPVEAGSNLQTSAAQGLCGGQQHRQTTFAFAMHRMPLHADC